jgi:hypothetical protein
MRDARHAGKRHDQARGNERVSKAIEEFRSFASTLAAQNIEHVNLPIALYEERWLQLNEVQSAFECPHSQQLHLRSSLRDFSAVRKLTAAMVRSTTMARQSDSDSLCDLFCRPQR